MFGAPVLILSTPGRKSGRLLETPLMYLEDGANLFLIASKGGAPQHPAWYHNLVSNPDVTALVGSSEKAFRAEAITEGPERDRLYARAVAVYKRYADYEKKTDRVIPVVLLKPT